MKKKILVLFPNDWDKGELAREKYANEALVYTWAGAEGDHVTLVTALFTDRGQGSRVEFTHGVFSSKPAKEAHMQGWMACFQMLDKTLEHA